MWLGIDVGGKVLQGLGSCLFPDLAVHMATGPAAQYSAVCPDGLRACLVTAGLEPTWLCTGKTLLFTWPQDREARKAKCARMTCVSFAGSSSQPSLCTWPQEVGSKTAKGVRYARLATSRDALAHTAWGPRTILPYSGRLAGHSRRDVGVCAL